MRLLIAAVSGAENPSGVCRHAWNLVRCALMCDEIDSITVLVGRWQLGYFAEWNLFEDSRISLVEVAIPNRPISKNFWYLFSLPTIAKGIGIDVVHLAFPVPFIRRRFGCAIVASLHDLYPYDQAENFGFPGVWFNRAFLHRCLREIDYAICVSEVTAARLNMWMPRFYRRKSIAIRNCVDTGRMALPGARRSHPVECPFFLMVAQHRANKNIEFALDVFGELLRRGEIEGKTELILVGNPGPETNRIRRRIEAADLRAKVRLLDGLSDGELFALYSNCEVLLVPSLAEGFCLPVIEALCCGSRVVCSDIPVLREIGGDACRYFDLSSDSPREAMMDAIHIALREDKRQRMTFEQFSIENTASKYMSVYRKAVAVSS